MENFHPLYNAALDADAAFQRELERVYGRNACNARYFMDSAYTDESLIMAASAFKSASAAWLECVANYRKSA